MLACDAYTSFVMGTPIQGLMVSCLYDELVRNARGNVVEPVCPELPIEIKSSTTQNPRTVQSVSPVSFRLYIVQYV